MISVEQTIIFFWEKKNTYIKERKINKLD